MCVSVYDLDDDRVGRRRPSASSIVHTDYIIIVSEDEQCRKGGDTLERGRPELSILTSLPVSVDVKLY